MTETEKAAFAKNVRRLVAEIGLRTIDTVVGHMQISFIDCDPEAGTLTVAFPGLPWECNPTGAVHGGMVSTMFDTAMGIAAYALADHLTPTMSLTTSFLRPAPCDGKLVIHSRITMTGRSVIYASAEMWEEKTPDKIVATSQAVFHRSQG